MESRIEKARLRWLCRRGMKELDVLLERFLNTQYDDLKPEYEQAFMRLMQMEDPDLMAVLMGKQPAPDDECANVIELLRNLH
ncbi:MAG: succinate dehydrogenase assembly factor 2 [Nevskiales bacterium]